MTLEERFEQFSDEYIKFESVENKRSQRPDLHAFLLLDELQPGDSDLISASEHDEFFFGIDLEKLEEVVTDEQILELVRCGVRLDSSVDSLCMFA